MRKLLIILSIAFVFVSCSKEQITHQTNNGVIHIEYEEDQEPEFPTPPTPKTQQNYPDWMMEKYNKVTHYDDSIYNYHPNNTIFDTYIKKVFPYITSSLIVIYIPKTTQVALICVNMKI